MLNRTFSRDDPPWPDLEKAQWENMHANMEIIYEHILYYVMNDYPKTKIITVDGANYDENIILWEDWDFRIRMSTKYHYGYCQNVNSAYRRLENGLHNSAPELHYREQIKIYNKNKHLMADLEDGDKRAIHNRVYSWLKESWMNIIKSNLEGKKYIQLIVNIFQFIKKEQLPHHHHLEQRVVGRI